jgi:hypothetical protein
MPENLELKLVTPENVEKMRRNGAVNFIIDRKECKDCKGKAAPKVESAMTVDDINLGIALQKTRHATESFNSSEPDFPKWLAEHNFTLAEFKELVAVIGTPIIAKMSERLGLTKQQA